MPNPVGAKVTGVGVVSCLGLGLRPLFDACLAGKTGLRLDDELGGHTGRIADSALQEARRRVEAHPVVGKLYASEPLLGLRGKATLLTAYALAEALGDEEAFGPDTGLIFATTTGHIASWEHELPLYVDGSLSAKDFAAHFRDYPLSRSIDAVTRAPEWDGPVQVLTSACAAGAQALALARRWLGSGKVKRCFVGATETLTHLTARGFGCFNLLAPEVATPFGQDRAGINLSEAAVFFKMEQGGSSPALGYVAGGATTMDAYDMTRPHPEGRGIHGAMLRALADARLEPRAIDWLNAHGTGTMANDAAEAAAIRMIFGKVQPWVSSTKSIHGHALGASGLLEAALAFEAMRLGQILPSSHTRVEDQSLGLKIATAPVRQPLRHVLKTTLGFGGINAALVLGRGDTP